MALNDEFRTFFTDCAQACKLELYGFELMQSAQHKKIIVYIDAPNSVTSDDCQRMAQHIRISAPVELPLLQNMQLEVSSPGVERRLFTMQHIHANLHKTVRLRCKTPIEQQRNFSGVLTRCDLEHSTLTLKQDSGEVTFTWDNIDKIRIVFTP